MTENIYRRRNPRYSLEIYAPGESQFVADYRGTQDIPEQPNVLHCDYCHALVDRLWGRTTRPCGAPLMYPKYRVVLPNPCHWWACVQCEGLRSADDWETLVARVITMQGFEPAMAPVYVELYLGMNAAWTGELATWEAGQPWPVQIP